MTRGVGDERGQVLPLIALVIVCASGACLLLGRVGEVAADRARAVTAADAAALAGAMDGQDAARALAKENGGQLVEYDQLGGDARVVVRVGRATATARARPAPPRP